MFVGAGWGTPVSSSKKQLSGPPQFMSTDSELVLLAEFPFPVPTLSHLLNSATQ